MGPRSSKMHFGITASAVAGWHAREVCGASLLAPYPHSSEGRVPSATCCWGAWRGESHAGAPGQEPGIDVSIREGLHSAGQKYFQPPGPFPPCAAWAMRMPPGVRQRDVPATQTLRGQVNTTNNLQR